METDFQYQGVRYRVVGPEFAHDIEDQGVIVYRGDDEPVAPIGPGMVQGPIDLELQDAARRALCRAIRARGDAQ